MTTPNQHEALQHRDGFGYTPLHYAAYIGSTAHALTILHHANASGIAKTLLESSVTGNHFHRGMTPEQVAFARQNCAVARVLGSTKPCPTVFSDTGKLHGPQLQGTDGWSDKMDHEALETSCEIQTYNFSLQLTKNMWAELIHNASVNRVPFRIVNIGGIISQRFPGIFDFASLKALVRTS